MPEYLAPGVFVEETSFRSKSIEGVGTSVAAIVGPTRFGPLRGKPEVLTSFEDFVRLFGDAKDLQFGATPRLNQTAIAARAFFDNGGRKLFVSRIVNKGNDGDNDGIGTSAARGKVSTTTGGGKLTFISRFPGKAGNVLLQLRWRDSENLLSFAPVANLAVGEKALLTAVTPAKAIKPKPAALGDNDAVTITAVVTQGLDGAIPVFTVEGTKFTATKGADAVDLAGTTLEISKLTSWRLTTGKAKEPAFGTLADGTAATISFNGPTNLSTFTGIKHWGDTFTTLRGKLKDGGKTFTIIKALNKDIEVTYNAEENIPIYLLAAAKPAASTLLVQRTFDLDVRRGTHPADKLVDPAHPDIDHSHGEVFYSITGLNTNLSGDGSLADSLVVTPTTKQEQLTQPIAVLADPGTDVLAAVLALCDAGALAPAADDVEGERYLIPLSGGTDGDEPTQVDYAGEIDQIKGNTGLAAFESVEDISIVLSPAAADLSLDDHTLVVNELLKHCKKMKYRMGIVDSRKATTVSEVREFAGRFDDSRLALYYPWVVTGDPEASSSGRKTITVPPSGFVAGVYANTDVIRGVHKAPANETVIGALRFEQDINQFQQELLNPEGINCLRSFPGRGNRVWGGRTLSSDPEWKYVNVRRYFLYLERSVDKSTQWVVFEPNGERLWDNVRTTVEGFLYNEWSEKRLLGSSPKEAFFVRCDRSTMTQNDLDNGRLICLVGVAPLRPAEFVIFRVGQKTADA